MLKFRNKTEACKAYEAIFVLLDISSEVLPTLSTICSLLFRKDVEQLEESSGKHEQRSRKYTLWRIIGIRVDFHSENNTKWKCKLEVSK